MVCDVGASDIHDWHHDEMWFALLRLRYRMLAYVVQCTTIRWLDVLVLVVVHEVLLGASKHGVVRNHCECADHG